MKQIKNSLGIVIHGRTIVVAEAGSDGTGLPCRRTAEFRLPDGAALDSLAAHQAAFAAFLKEHGFRSRKAVVGIAARQVVSAPVKIPPIADVQLRQQTVAMALQRSLKAEFNDVVYDCFQHRAADTDLLALMTLRKNITAIREFLAASRITPLSVTVASLGLEITPDRPLECHLVDYPDSLEAIIFCHQRLQALLNIPKKNGPLPDANLAAETARQIKRTLWSLSDKESTPCYTLWTTVGDAATVRQAFSGTFENLTVREIKTSNTGAGVLAQTAAQLARRAVTGNPVAVNFLNTHQAPKTATLSKQWKQRIILVAAAAVLLLAAYFYGWYADTVAIADCREQLQTMKESVTAAEEMINRVGYARRWFGQEPVHLENLRQLTLAFPQSSDIWLTSLAVDESLNQVITGRATHEEAILDVVDTLKDNPQFKDIKLLYIRKMGKSSSIMTFAINFNGGGDQ